ALVVVVDVDNLVLNLLLGQGLLGGDEAKLINQGEAGERGLLPAGLVDEPVFTLPVGNPEGLTELLAVDVGNEGHRHRSAGRLAAVEGLDGGKVDAGVQGLKSPETILRLLQPLAGHVLEQVMHTDSFSNEL